MTGKINKFLILVALICSTGLAKNSSLKWFKGNTHTHTTLGDGDSKPEKVAQWYHDYGYNFVVLSEHNKYISPADIKLREKNRRSDFILIPGVEITNRQKKFIIHTTSMNVDKLPNWKHKYKTKTEIVQHHVRETLKNNGQPILNHPNFAWALELQDILPVNNLHMFEIFNGHPKTRSYGDANHLSTEQLWDQLLTRGLVIWAVSADDAHDFKKWSSKKSNPGRGWVMVKAKELTPESIVQAMMAGNFYASNGVVLSRVDNIRNSFEILVDVIRTLETINTKHVLGRKVKKQDTGFKIEFIGPGGQVLETLNQTSGKFQITEAYAYIRAKITYTRKTKKGKFEQFYAWSQPIFTDSRESIQADTPD